MKKTLADTIREAREKKGLTQTQLGRAIGISTDGAAQVTISKYERGIMSPLPFTVRKLIAALGLPKKRTFDLLFKEMLAV